MNKNFYKEMYPGIKILFENDFCLILNKASGLAVQGGHGIKHSLDSILEKNFTPRPLLVHRLDKDTSGIILTAKSREAAAFFSALLLEHKIKRKYKAICKNIPEKISALIEHDLENRASSTFYRVLCSVRPEKESPEDLGSFSLLELKLGTGRMHQIRRHLLSIGNPVLGDDKYGDFSLNKKLKKYLGLKCLLLHACELSIPVSDLFPEGLKVSSDMPPPFSLFTPCEP